MARDGIAGKLTHCGGEIWVDPDYVGRMCVFQAMWDSGRRGRTNEDAERAYRYIAYSQCPHIYQRIFTRTFEFSI